MFRARPSVLLEKVANGAMERDWSQECCHGNNIVGVTLFLLSCTFLVPSLNNIASVSKMFLIQYFIV